MPSKEQRYLWTLNLKGGSGPFEMQIPGNPTLFHDRGTSSQHLFVSISELFLIKTACENQGIQVFYHRMQGEEDSQREEKNKLLLRDTEVFVLTPKCPECPWYDPVTLGTGKTCFLREAPRESSLTLLKNSDAHHAAAINCPLNT